MYYFLYSLFACLLLLPFLLVMFDIFFRIVFLTVVSFPKKQKKTEFDSGINNFSILFVLPAHNEERILEKNLEILHTQLMYENNVDLLLLADHCSDTTVDIALRNGVQVVVRIDGDFGKGRALSWLVTEKKEILDDYDLIVVIDADTLIAEDFCTVVRKVFSAKADSVQVVQSYVEPVNSNGQSLASLAAFSEILSQEIDDKARLRLGWTSPLRGTGMVFQREIFLRACQNLQTQVDDIEISLHLADMDIQVVYCPDLKIFDPKSVNMLELASQRGRWLKGQREIWRGWTQSIGKLTSISNWALLHALLLKPKTAMFLMKVVLLSIFCFYQANIFAIPLVVILLSLFIDLIYYLSGLRYVSDPQKYLLSFLSAPLFLVMWGVGWFFSFGKKKEWLRARD